MDVRRITNNKPRECVSAGRNGSETVKAGACLYVLVLIPVNCGPFLGRLARLAVAGALLCTHRRSSSVFSRVESVDDLLYHQLLLYHPITGRPKRAAESASVHTVRPGFEGFPTGPWPNETDVKLANCESPPLKMGWEHGMPTCLPQCAVCWQCALSSRAGESSRASSQPSLVRQVFQKSEYKLNK